MKEKWPKKVVELTAPEQKLKEQIWVDAQKWGYTGIFGWIQDLGHRYINKMSPQKEGRILRTLELGCGSGRHFSFSGSETNAGIDIRYSLLQEAHANYPGASLAQADVYALPFKDDVFDRIISIYVFEHLHNLPTSLEEACRVLRSNGELFVALPAEGGLALDIGRRLTSKRYFERNYNVDYLYIVQSEHCNTCREVIEEIGGWFKIEIITYLPFFLPSIHLNAVVVLKCVNNKQ